MCFFTNMQGSESKYASLTSPWKQGKLHSDVDLKNNLNIHGWLRHSACCSHLYRVIRGSVGRLQSLGDDENFTQGPGILHLHKSVKVHVCRVAYRRPWTQDKHSSADSEQRGHDMAPGNELHEPQSQTTLLKTVAELYQISVDWSFSTPWFFP